MVTWDFNKINYLIDFYSVKSSDISVDTIKEKIKGFG